MRASSADLVTLLGGHTSSPAMAASGVGRSWGGVMKTTARRRAEGKSFFAQEREEGNQSPRGYFYRRSAPRPHHLHRRSRGKEQPSPAPSPGEKFETPTPSNFHARRTRALISQVKRRVW